MIVFIQAANLRLLFPHISSRSRRIFIAITIKLFTVQSRDTMRALTNFLCLAAVVVPSILSRAQPVETDVAKRTLIPDSGIGRFEMPYHLS
jgi:hypothetical protein